MLRKRDIPAMNVKLSIHLATAYISFAPVRVLRTGAFCFFNFFLKSALKSHLPNGYGAKGAERTSP